MFNALPLNIYPGRKGHVVAFFFFPISWTQCTISRVCQISHHLRLRFQVFYNNLPTPTPPSNQLLWHPFSACVSFVRSDRSICQRWRRMFALWFSPVREISDSRGDTLVLELPAIVKNGNKLRSRRQRKCLLSCSAPQWVGVVSKKPRAELPFTAAIPCLCCAGLCCVLSFWSEDPARQEMGCLAAEWCLDTQLPQVASNIARSFMAHWSGRNLGNVSVRQAIPHFCSSLSLWPQRGCCPE